MQSTLEVLCLFKRILEMEEAMLLPFFNFYRVLQAILSDSIHISSNSYIYVSNQAESDILIKIKDMHCHTSKLGNRGGLG